MNIRTSVLKRFFTLCLIPSALFAYAEEPYSLADTTANSGLIDKVLNYFEQSNKTEITTRPDFSIIGGPHYSSDSKLGLGLVAAGLYTTSLEDSIPFVSNFSIYADATTAAHFSVGIRGEHILPHNTWRLTYDFDFSSIDTQFWGIGYDQCKNDANETDYKYLALSSWAIYAKRIGSSLYIGPRIAVNYFNARNLETSTIWDGLPRHTFNWGVGLSLRYDTRDNSTAPKTGVCLTLEQTFNPSFLGNDYDFSVNEFAASYYRPAWKDCTLAARLHWRIADGDVPWGLLSYIGGSDNMRGYFEQRYRDKSEIDICVEMRQHIYHRNGIVFWVGAATLFPKLSDFSFDHILPNCGIGYRWEFKQNVNVRIDFGIGRGQTGIIFNINEAF